MRQSGAGKFSLISYQNGDFSCLPPPMDVYLDYRSKIENVLVSLIKGCGDDCKWRKYLFGQEERWEERIRSGVLQSEQK